MFSIPLFVSTSVCRGSGLGPRQGTTCTHRYIQKIEKEIDFLTFLLWLSNSRLRLTKSVVYDASSVNIHSNPRRREITSSGLLLSPCPGIFPPEHE